MKSTPLSSHPITLSTNGSSVLSTLRRSNPFATSLRATPTNQRPTTSVTSAKSTLGAYAMVSVAAWSLYCISSSMSRSFGCQPDSYGSCDGRASAIVRKPARQAALEADQFGQTDEFWFFSRTRAISIRRSRR